MDSSATLFQNTLQSFSIRSASELYTPGQNLVYSPASLSAALGLVLEGSGGLTQKEIINSLIDPRFRQGDEEAAEKASNFLAELGGGHSSAKKLVNSANFFYSNKSLVLLESYAKAIKEKYSATFRQFNFRDDNTRAQAVDTINGDVKEATQGMIPKLLGPKDIEKDTMAVLVNAIHFKGLWEEGFKENKTSLKGDFHLPNGETIHTPMMNNRGEFRVGRFEKSGAKLLRLPYASINGKEQVYMVVVLPEDGKIQQFLTDFDVEDFNHAVNHASYGYTLISLPRFKIETTHTQLKETLKKLGISHIFENNGKARDDPPDFSRMSKTSLFVSKIVQKAVIECNEEGTKAAAATYMRYNKNINSASLPPPPRTFYADRPFVYALVAESESRIKNILFVGVVENPTKE